MTVCEILALFVPFGFTLLNDAMVSCMGKQPTNMVVSFMKRFLRDNTHLDLLNASASTPLAEHFSDIIH